MMRPTIALSLCLFLILAISAQAADGRLPEVVAHGFDMFQKNGTLAAISAWLDGSARETDEPFQDEAAARMNQAQADLGQMIGYDVVRVVILSNTTQRDYVVMKFEKGVGWMYFDCYSPQNRWIVTRFDFHRNAGLILPPNILSGR